MHAGSGMKGQMTSYQHPQRLAAAGVLFALMTIMASASCSRPMEATGVPSPSPSPAPAKAPDTKASQGKQQMSPLQSMLEIFLTKDGNAWQAYDAIASVNWRDSTPVASEGALDPKAAYKRGGTILLSGFGVVELPNGKTGAEAGSRQDNEGNSGITLFGTADRVESMAIMKFYASEDYSRILKNQFGPGIESRLIANSCGAESDADPEGREFYSITFPGLQPVYAEIYVDAEGGKYSPGSTTFEFYRSQPTDKIKSLGCHDIGKN